MPPLTAIRLPPGEGMLVLGRDGGAADVVLSHPSISRRHVLVQRAPDGCMVRDLGSTNGTFLDGRALTAPTPLRDGAVLEIGPYRLVRRGEALEVDRGADSSTLQLRSLSFAVRVGDQSRTLVDAVSVQLSGPGLTCVLGPSGSGKSTLLGLLAGRLTPTGGQVLIDGVDVHRHFARVKDRLAFVPQREALRDELTVAEFLRFSAQLRLPPDLSRREADALVLHLVDRTGLAERLETPIRALSGGQRRRLGMVNELLSQPTVLLLDEVTSGLDEEAAHDLMSLVADIASGGVTVVCVTHTIGTIEGYADQCLVLAPGGVPIYLGPPRALAGTFGVSSIAEIYGPIRDAPRMPAPRLPPHTADEGPTLARTPRDAGTRLRRLAAHARLQVLRNLTVALGDRPALALALGQAMLIGVLLRLVFGSESLGVERVGQLGFLLAISAFWFGANNAARELVKDLELIRQEWAVGIDPGPTLAARAIVLLSLCTLQVLLLLATVRVAGVALTDPAGLARTCLLGAAVGTGVGLLLSAAARTTDAASTGLPMLLIPQLLLSDAFVRPLDGVAGSLAKLCIPAFWLNRSILELSGAARLDALSPTIALAVHLTISMAGAAWLLARRLRG